MVDTAKKPIEQMEKPPCMIAGRFCYAFILGLPLCLFPARLRGFNRCRVYLYHRASKRRQKPTEAAQGGRRKQSIKGRGTATATLKPTGQPHQQPATGDTATAEKQDMRKSAKSLSATFCGFFFNHFLPDLNFLLLWRRDTFSVTLRAAFRRRTG